MDSRGEKSNFAKLCRELRISRNLKQRDVAAVIGVRPATYGNVESSPYKVVRQERVEALAKFYGLAQADRLRLLEAWEQTPVSPYSARQREQWAKQNLVRSKARNYERLQLALVETLAVLVTRDKDPDSLCYCEFGGGTAADPHRACELCSALEALGLDRWTTLDRTITQLSQLQDKLEAAAEARGRKRGRA